MQDQRDEQKPLWVK